MNEAWNAMARRAQTPIDPNRPPPARANNSMAVALPSYLALPGPTAVPYYRPTQNENQRNTRDISILNLGNEPTASRPVLSPPPHPDGYVNATASEIIEASKAPEMQPTPSPEPGPSPTIDAVVNEISPILLTATREYLQGAVNVTKGDLFAVVHNTTLRDSIIIGGHNTVTTTPRMLPFTATPLAQANQQMSLEAYLESCSTTGKCLLDIDMWKTSDGSITSIHGGPKVGRFINVSPDVNTRQILEKVHTFAASHPDVTFIIRSENHEVNANDIESMWSPGMRDQVVGISKQDNPTHGQLQAGGKNILYFLENTNDNDVDSVTGRVRDTLIHAQDNFFVRTMWDKIDEIMRADDITPFLAGFNASKLGPYPMVMIDGYVTAVGANVKGLDKQANFLASIPTDVLPKIKVAMANAGLNANISGAVVMADHVNSDMFAYQAGLDMFRQIPDGETRDFLESHMATTFVEAQRQVNSGLRQGILDRAVRIYKGRANTTDIPLPTVEVTSIIVGLYLLTAMIGKIDKGNLDDFTNLKDDKVVKVPRDKILRIRTNLAKFINDKEKKYPPLRVLLRKAYNKGKLLRRSHLDRIVEVEREENENNNDPREATVSPPRGSNTGSDPRSPGSAEKGVQLSKGQKKKEAQRRKQEFYTRAYNAGGGYTRKLKR
jgi:hypothetical protein